MSDQANREQEKQDDDAGHLGAGLDFLRLLWAVDHGLQSASKRMQALVGVTGPQRLALRIVGRFPNVAAGRIAQILHVHPSTLTGILQRLEARGLMQRRSDPRDGRRALFALTRKGRRLDGLKTGTVEASVRRALARLPELVPAASRLLSAVAEELAAPE